MTFFESTLIYVAKAVLAFWDGVKAVLGWVGALLDAILQPVLSPLLRMLNPLCTTIADAVYKLFQPLPAWLGLVVISAAAGIIMLVAFRYLSNQTGIARAKDDIKANLLALKLFKDDLRVALRAQGRILWALARLQRYILVPVLWMALPTMLLLAQMAMRYQWRPLLPGEQTILKIHSSEAARLAGTAKVEPHPSIDDEIGPIADGDDICWRLRVLEPGRHSLRIHLGEVALEKQIEAGSAIQRVSPVRPDSSWTRLLLYPVERPIDAASEVSVASIDVAYPQLRSVVYGSDYWVLTFFVVSMLTAILLKPLFKVRF